MQGAKHLPVTCVLSTELQVIQDNNDSAIPLKGAWILVEEPDYKHKHNNYLRQNVLNAMNGSQKHVNTYICKEPLLRGKREKNTEL